MDGVPFDRPWHMSLSSQLIWNCTRAYNHKDNVAIAQDSPQAHGRGGVGWRNAGAKRCKGRVGGWWRWCIRKSFGGVLCSPKMLVMVVLEMNGMLPFVAESAEHQNPWMSRKKLLTWWEFLSMCFKPYLGHISFLQVFKSSRKSVSTNSRFELWSFNLANTLVLIDLALFGLVKSHQQEFPKAVLIALEEGLSKHGHLPSWYVQKL